MLSGFTMVNGMTAGLSTANWIILGFYSIAILLIGEWSIGPFVAGAADNASGAAAALSLAEAWLEDPVNTVELVVVLPGCEESGMIGSAAWADRHREELNAVPTVFVNFDNLGVGPPRFFDAETPLFGWPIAYPDEMVRIARALRKRSVWKTIAPTQCPDPPMV